MAYMDIVLTGLDSTLVYLLPVISLLLFFRTKFTFNNYLSIICAINLGFAGWVLGNYIHLGHWCIPCLLSSGFALAGFFLCKLIPKFGSFLLAFSLPFFFYPMLWSVFPGIPELDLLIITSLLAICFGLRALKWEENYNRLMIKAYASAFLLHSFVLCFSKLELIDSEAIVSNNEAFHLGWLIAFILLLIGSLLCLRFSKNTAQKSQPTIS